MSEASEPAGPRASGKARIDVTSSRPGEPPVDGARALAALVDRPDDQRLAAARVAGGEDAVRPTSRSAGASALPRASRSTPSCSSRPVSGPRKPIASSTSSAGCVSSVPGDRLERRHAGVLAPSGSARRGRSPREVRGRDREVALAALVQRVGGAELHRPARPRRDVVGPRGRRLADELDLRHRRGALAVRVADAVGARVAAADHDHVLAGRRDHRSRARARRRRSGCAGRGTPSRSGRRRARARAPAGRAGRASRSRRRPRRDRARSSPASTSTPTSTP